MTPALRLPAAVLVRPPERGTRHTPVHLDFQVDDPAAAGAHAESPGAGPRGRCTEAFEDVRIHAAPDGRPFCLFVRLGKTPAPSAGEA